LKKNLFLIPAMVFAVCAIATGQTPSPVTPTTPAKTVPPAPVKPAGPPPTRIAIINIQQAVVNTQEGQKATAELQTKFNPRKSALEKRQNDLISLQDQLKKGGPTMSEAAKEKIMRDIDSNNKSLNRDAEDFNSDIEQENTKNMQEMGNKVMAILDQYAAQNGYAVILDVSNQQNPVFWADASTNITGDIVKLYDQAHPVVASLKPTSKPPASAPPPAKKQ
jgi:outer membrane protein